MTETEILTPEIIADKVYHKHPAGEVKRTKIKALKDNIDELIQSELNNAGKVSKRVKPDELKLLLQIVKIEIKGRMSAYELRNSTLLVEIDETLEKL